MLTDPPAVLGALSDPLRWRLIGELGRSDRRVNELVHLLGKPQNLVSYHLGVLRDAGIVSGRRSSADGRDVYYRADLSRCRDLLAGVGTSLHPGLSFVATPDDRVVGNDSVSRVLFLCTGNSARSQMAEAFVEHGSPGTVVARSAGSHPKALHPDAVQVMAERGIDILGRPTKSISRFLGDRFDRVVTLCDKVREICPEFPGAPITTHWSIADPAAADNPETRLTSFRAVADEIEERVVLLLADLRNPPLERTHHE